MFFLISVFIIQLLFLSYLAVSLRNLGIKSRKFENKLFFLEERNRLLLHESISFFLKDKIKKNPILNCSSLKIKKVKSISIPGVITAYNGALIEEEEDFRLFFREDLFLTQKKSFTSKIGSILLNQEFEVKEKEPTWIDTKSLFSEDARVFFWKESLFLLYNDLEEKGRILKLAKLSKDKKSCEQIKSLPTFSQKVEKNWTPFIFEDNLYFHYQIHPQKTFLYRDGELEKLQVSNLLDLSFWTNRWGQIRGGTCAKLVEGVYLAFFHSSFEEPCGRVWYVMGAYTFSSQSPFQVQAISSSPIFFDGIYDSLHQNSAKPYLFSIYPMGFVVQGDKIFLSCGENDSSIKILEIDSKELFASLKPIGAL